MQKPHKLSIAAYFKTKKLGEWEMVSRSIHPPEAEALPRDILEVEVECLSWLWYWPIRLRIWVGSLGEFRSIPTVELCPLHSTQYLLV